MKKNKPTLYDLLERVGWTGNELARRLGCGLSTVPTWQRNGKTPNEVLDFLEKIAILVESEAPPRVRLRAVPISKRTTAKTRKKGGQNVRLL